MIICLFCLVLHFIRLLYTIIIILKNLQKLKVFFVFDDHQYMKGLFRYLQEGGDYNGEK